jgi:hypothetical protein
MIISTFLKGGTGSYGIQGVPAFYPQKRDELESLLENSTELKKIEDILLAHDSLHNLHGEWQIIIERLQKEHKIFDNEVFKLLFQFFFFLLNLLL